MVIFIRYQSHCAPRLSNYFSRKDLTTSRTGAIGRDMKTYIVYDGNGDECGYVKARSHNEAEKKAKKLFGEQAMVVYTEL
jgi:hypothetical protein